MSKGTGYKPLIMKSLYLRSTTIRDQLLKILMLCKEFEATSVTLDIEDMNRLFVKYNPIVSKLFQDHCFM